MENESYDKPTEYENLENLFGSEDTAIGIISFFESLHEHQSRQEKCCYFSNSLFALLCCDEDLGYLKVSKKSYKRAKRLLQRSGDGEKLLYDLNEDILETFYGFMSDELTAALLRPKEWLLRLNENGFIISKKGEATNKEATVEDIPIIFKNGKYIMGDISADEWEPILQHLGRQSCVKFSPFWVACRDVNDFSDPMEAPYLWKNIIDAEYSAHLFVFEWHIAATKPIDLRTYLNKTLCDAAKYYDTQVSLRVMKKCLDLGGDINDPVHNTIDAFSSRQSNNNARPLADFIWNNGGDPNTRNQQGMPVFWQSPVKQNGVGAKYFLCNPKLDVNMVYNGYNMVSYLSTDIDLDVFDHPNFEINRIWGGNRSALDVAIEAYEFPMIQRLIFRGADVQKLSSKGNGTFLHLLLELPKQAKDQDLVQTIEALVDAGTDVNALNPSYRTALHIAAALRTPAVVRALVQKKANVNGHRESDTTPLHLAAERGNIPMVNTLLELGADPTIRNSQGLLPFDVALYATKALFSHSTASQRAITFTGTKVTIDQPNGMSPQGSTNMTVIGDYVYCHGGTYFCFDWYYDDGYRTLELQHRRVFKFYRLKISMCSMIDMPYSDKRIDNPFSKTEKRLWEEIDIQNKLSYRHDYYDRLSYLAVNDQLWFPAENEFTIFEPATMTWTPGPARHGLNNAHDSRPSFRYENFILRPSTQVMVDKTTGTKHSFEVDEGDYESSHCSGVIQSNNLWCLPRIGNALFVLNFVTRRWYKVFQFAEFKLNSFLACFGERFLIAIASTADDFKLFVLDLESFQYQLHDIELDVRPEDYDVLTDTQTDAKKIDEAQKRIETVSLKLEPLLNSKKIPFNHSAVAIHETTLIVFGGYFDDTINSNYMYAIDLSPLVPHLSLEQLAALAIKRNRDKIDKKSIDQIPEMLRVKTNLWW